VLTYGGLHGLAGLNPRTISAVGASVVAAGLVYGMLFDRWPRSPEHPGRERLTAVGALAVLAALAYVVLTAYANGLHWTTAAPEDWVSYVCLNALGAGVILHVAIGRRWPFAATA
jgi:hypothetical protein